MRYSEGDLPILNAEVYDEGSPLGSPMRRTQSRKKQASSSSSRGTEENPRKRPRPQAGSAPGDGDETKRTRGRPRLDTKDETAADTLEKKVQNLKQANEEMSNAFMQLHEYAIKTGLLEQLPDFGHQLRQTTEKFLSVAREVSDDDSKDGEDKATSSHAKSKPSSQRSRSDSPRQTELRSSFEPVTQANLNTSFTLAQQPPSLLALPPAEEPTTFGYEVLTHPTLENATFSFQPTPPQLFSGSAQSLPLYESPPVPHTFTHLEATFGRRLQRYSIEQALALLTMPDPPQRLISRVFGFCLLLESTETIKRRLRRVLAHEPQQSLYYWGYPFHNLGRAGKHFEALSSSPSSSSSPSPSRSSPKVGNQGMVDVLKPQATAGFGIGPFSAQINSVRDRELDEDMRMALAEFAGEYFDCDEAELYLYRRGVVIPPGSDVVTVDVDLSQMESYKEHGWWATTADPLGDGSSSSDLLSPDGSSSGSGGLLERQTMQQGVGVEPWLGGDGAGMVDPALAGVLPQDNTFLPAMNAAGSWAAGGGDILPFGFLRPDESANLGYGMGTARQSPNRRRVVVKTMTLVKEITTRGICLGRTPGFRQIDLDEAFWESVKASLV
ncbi:hypothetical protein C7999DRAFT_44206 [Corynascus novoguineensis]|uniref:Uncharacterized protein n=1 Tax=Corynascus novoguineensis TaxID=1126955 RepID=A0AAN7HG45_9PEZI|nr:hypothetical protein C7999DRAFT_44206 [Corynascus novoguineensis]